MSTVGLYQAALPGRRGQQMVAVETISSPGRALGISADRVKVLAGQIYRPRAAVFHRKRDSIEAHLTIVFAALAVTRFTEDRTGWSIKKFVRTARRYRTVQIRAGHHTLTAEDPLPPNLREALALIK